MKKLNLEHLAVESFEAGREAPALRGTVRANAGPTDNCNSRSPHCLTPSVYQPCITDDVECTV